MNIQFSLKFEIQSLAKRIEKYKLIARVKSRYKKQRETVSTKKRIFIFFFSEKYKV